MLKKKRDREMKEIMEGEGGNPEGLRDRNGLTITSSVLYVRSGMESREGKAKKKKVKLRTMFNIPHRTEERHNKKRRVEHNE